MKIDEAGLNIFQTRIPALTFRFGFGRILDNQNLCVSMQNSKKPESLDWRCANLQIDPMPCCAAQCQEIDEWSEIEFL